MSKPIRTDKARRKQIGQSGTKTSGEIPKGVNLWCFDAIKLEIIHGGSSMLLAYAGAMHLNDFLHSAGLITDDAWNAVKGMSTLFTEATNITNIASQVGSTLKTLVEAASPLIPQGNTQTTTDEVAQPTNAELQQQLIALGSLGGAEAEESE